MCALAVFPLYRILVFERIKVKLEKAVSQVRALEYTMLLE